MRFPDPNPALPSRCTRMRRWSSRWLISLERRDDATKRIGDALQVVAALGRYDNSAVAAIVGNRDHPRRQTGEAIGFQTHPAERVVFVGVESGRDQDQLWAERFQDRPRDRGGKPLVGDIG